MRRPDPGDLTVFDAALELAENANTYVPLAPGDERVTTDRYVLWMGGRGDEPGWNVAQRFRFGPRELDEVRAEIHRHLRSHGPHRLHVGGGVVGEAVRPRRAPASRSAWSRRKARRPSGWC